MLRKCVRWKSRSIWKTYIDYEAYGRIMNLDDDGRFTDGGYVVRTGDSFTEYYSGRDDLPEEYRIFALSRTGKIHQENAGKLRER